MDAVHDPGRHAGPGRDPPGAAARRRVPLRGARPGTRPGDRPPPAAAHPAAAPGIRRLPPQPPDRPTGSRGRARADPDGYLLPEGHAGPGYTFEGVAIRP